MERSQSGRLKPADLAADFLVMAWVFVVASSLVMALYGAERIGRWLVDFYAEMSATDMIAANVPRPLVDRFLATGSVSSSDMETLTEEQRTVVGRALTGMARLRPAVTKATSDAKVNSLRTGSLGVLTGVVGALLVWRGRKRARASGA